MTQETALGLVTAGRWRTLDVCAGATSDLAVVAGGHGGHGTGWSSARLAVRGLCDDHPADAIGCAAADPDGLDVALALVRASPV